jgi:hypothetical protein
MIVPFQIWILLLSKFTSIFKMFLSSAYLPAFQSASWSVEFGLRLPTVKFRSNNCRSGRQQIGKRERAETSVSGSCQHTNLHARHWRLMPVILATQEAEIRRTVVQSQPEQISLWDPISIKPITKRGDAGGVAQGVGPEFKPQYQKKNPKTYTQCFHMVFHSIITTVLNK